ncbi:D-serine ammonia-lyase [Xylophilus rhododendri]|uniref:Probable D-serine dehydratase n=1 Tax=Xylophilus rhododendri TaxID=2697032 RepID=A0A857J713_9BURK|nr:D-serine ammonia-lyase [Xylophilus rhododendri]QHI98605.1 D-serine ammonia-lyase [Xylophilus rhododendri]
MTPSPSPLTLSALQAGQPVLWASGADRSGAAGPAFNGISNADVDGSVARLARFAPLLARLFPELEDSAGTIESSLLPVPRLQQALELPTAQGLLLVKADHALPVAGSIKARGGIHEVLEYAESVALQNGLLPEGQASDYRLLATPSARLAFGRYKVAVGSTGNLGLAIGVMASALGFQAVVHMSSDAKQWKKDRLRRRGVEVVEHAGDYAQAVAAGRRAADADPQCHFVDDEQSLSLLLGYAAAAPHLARQLAALGRPVDAEHPLFVYLPCGVGGAPGGIAFGLAQIYGPHVHCFFAEPTRSPCFLVEMLAGTPLLAHLGAHPSVYDVGQDNRTEADGLAVPRASELAAEVVKPFIGGVYTVEDDTLFRDLHTAAATEGLRIEPSAAAGLAGPAMLLGSEAGRAYLRRHGLDTHMAAATHIAWTTGGLFVPEEEYARFHARGAAMAQTA